MCNLCVAVGVSNYGQGMEALPGAGQAAREISKWAELAGYRTLVITDEKDDKGKRVPVTVDRLKGELEAILQSTVVERIIFYFAGHGTIASAASEKWLLSKAVEEPDEAIDRTSFLRQLATYNIPQVALFIDACRSQSKMGLDVHGRGVIRNSGAERTNPEVDIFLAASLGDSAFHVKDTKTGEYRCLFTDVLLTGLYGRHPLAIARNYHPEAPAVVSRTLKEFVKEEVTKKAAAINKKADAQIDAGFQLPNDVYLKITEARAEEVASQAEPPVGLGGGLMLDLPVGVGRREPWEVVVTAQHTPVERGNEEAAREALELVVPGFLKSGALKRADGSYHLPDEIRRYGDGLHGLAVWSKIPREIATSDPLPLVLTKDPQFLVVRCEGGSTNAFVQTNAQNWCFVPLLRGLLNCISFSETSMTAMSFVDVRFEGGSEGLERGYREVLGPLLTGDLRARDANWLADRIRYIKHANPVMGVIAAYLYAASGDVDNIVRMAHYYFGAYQPVPFDIAMLGASQLRWNRDPEQGFKVVADFPAVIKGREDKSSKERRPEFSRIGFGERAGLEVAGFMPWMTQGWNLFEREQRMEIPGALLEIRAEVLRGVFTSLSQQAGSYLLKELGFNRLRV